MPHEEPQSKTPYEGGFNTVMSIMLFWIKHNFHTHVGEIGVHHVDDDPKWKNPKYCPDHDRDSDPIEVRNMKDIVKIFTALDPKVSLVSAHETEPGLNLTVCYYRNKRGKWECSGPV